MNCLVVCVQTVIWSNGETNANETTKKKRKEAQNIVKKHTIDTPCYVLLLSLSVFFSLSWRHF